MQSRCFGNPHGHSCYYDCFLMPSLRSASAPHRTQHKASILLGLVHGAQEFCLAKPWASGERWGHIHAHMQTQIPALTFCGTASDQDHEEAHRLLITDATPWPQAGAMLSVTCKLRPSTSTLKGDSPPGPSQRPRKAKRQTGQRLQR